MLKQLQKQDPNEIKKLLIDQIYSTVKWRENSITYGKTRIKKFYRNRPGKSLIGMVKRTVKNM